MKKQLRLVILLFSLILLPGCGCKHEWTDANCISPRTCSLCSKTEGNIADHTWQNASCFNPQTCSICGVTQGDPVDHVWKDATCTAPQVCENCGTTQGDPLDHIPGYPVTSYDIVEAITYDITSCINCGEPVRKYAEKTFSYIGENTFRISADDFITRLNHILSERGNWTAEFETHTSDEEQFIHVNIISDGIKYASLTFCVPDTESEEHSYRAIHEEEKVDATLCNMRIQIDFLGIAKQLTGTEDIDSEEDFIEIYRWMVKYFSESSESLMYEIMLPIYKTIYPYAADWEIEMAISKAYFFSADYLSYQILFEEKWVEMYVQYANLFQVNGCYIITLSVTPDIFYENNSD